MERYELDEKPNGFSIIQSLFGEKETYASMLHSHPRDRIPVIVKPKGRQSGIEVVIDSVERTAEDVLVISCHTRDRFGYPSRGLHKGKKCKIIINPFIVNAYTNNLEGWSKQNKSYIEISDENWR